MKVFNTDRDREQYLVHVLQIIKIIDRLGSLLGFMYYLWFTDVSFEILGRIWGEFEASHFVQKSESRSGERPTATAACAVCAIRGPTPQASVYPPQRNQHFSGWRPGCGRTSKRSLRTISCITSGCFCCKFLCSIVSDIEIHTRVFQRSLCGVNYRTR